MTAAAALQFPAHAEGDPFAENVRTTAPLPPAEQVKTFHLPPGFEIDLVASEPQLAKPMNMAFDARGRLWFTTSYEYPFPKKPGEPARDQIKVLEDTDHDGRYDKVTTFAEGLNIPIAILPYGEGCLAWSIPNIYYFRDTDGDGKADRQDVIFGPLGWERDTHGNIASFRRGNDGWIYGTHGFNNNSTFKGRDGSTITVNSGNTYRFRPDGSRIEQYTWGQVNPFGMCFDERGYLYTADCHSSPIYQLIPGGYYPSFGKPDDGLGFSPTTIQHSHGSTAIAGILIVPEEGWPEDLRGNIFIGNVMTSRINRDRIEWRGSSPVGHEMPDFLSTDDPWFRPVDIQLGPDGALYVADFYNRIIGHYEVPLTHPGRDRERGRIWRIRYTGPGAVRGDLPDLTRMATPALMEQLASGNPVRRSLALNELVERPGMEAATLARQALTRSAAPAALKVGALWVLERTARVDGDLVRAAAGDSSPLVRQHAMRVIGSLSQPSPAGLSTLVRALQDPDPHVRRSAAEALAQHPSPTHLAPLLAALAKVPDQDTHLAHAIRISLRDQLRADGAFEEVTRSFQDEATWHTLAEVAIAVPTPESSRFLTTHVQRHRETPALLTRILKHASRYAGPEQFPGLMEIARKTQADLGQQLELLQAMRQGIAERGQPLPPTLRAWATDLAVGILKSAAEGSAGWQSLGIEGMKESASPWIFQERPRSRGGSSTLLSSLPPGGEALTGMLQSPEFTLPARLSFDLSGHDGYPDKPAQGRNHVRLREAGTGAILADAPPPRNDASRRIEWDLSKHAGKRGRVEVIDADTGDAYAWLAVGGFEPPIAGWPSIAPRDLADRVKSVTELADLTDLSLAAPALRELAINASTDLAIASAAARLLSAPGRAEGLPTLGVLAADPLLPAQSRRQLCGALAASDLARCDGILVEVLSQVSWRAQTRVAEVLAGHPRLAASLVDWVDQAKASPRLLREAAVKGKLESTLPAAVDRIRRLAAAAPEANADLQRLIDTRRAGYAPGKSDPARGAAVFAQTCAVCHKIEGTGNLVGPQLDGIGNRGIDRLCEDILDPNRNVDHAFRTHLIVQTDGEVVSGLPRREEGDSLVLANSAGQEFVVSKKSIKERRESANSLMPENFGEILSPADFNHLLAFLMSQAARARQ
ncbi:MAG TPA: hypothetical protein DCM86_00965 [Verrucomicrobiales bacterium]|nr:hypothetical protein [Verrucomicrobiales bacterium]